MFVDTHTHFYDEWLLPDAEAAVQRALEAGVGKMIQADVDSRERPAMWEIGNRHPGVIYQMLGLYPGSVAGNWREELDEVFRIAKCLNDGPRSIAAREVPGIRPQAIVAIGEIGLDYHEGTEFAAEQKEVLRLQLELAAKLDLPVNFHLRDAWEDFFSVLADASHLAQTVERIPMEKILLETDAPYLAPVPYRGKRNESAFIPLIAQRLADAKGLTLQEVEILTTHNAETLFSL